jgi:hypothetical protein
VVAEQDAALLDIIVPRSITAITAITLKDISQPYASTNHPTKHLESTAVLYTTPKETMS